MKLWRRKTFGRVTATIVGDPPWGFEIRRSDGTLIVSGRNARWTHEDACAAAAIQGELLADFELESAYGRLAELELSAGLASVHDLAAKRARESKRKRTH
jgi:hypothetical protein